MRSCGTATDETGVLRSNAHAVSLFREEALDAQVGKWLGDVVLVRPLSFAILTALVVVISATLCAIMVFGSYTKRITVYGQLVSAQGQLKVHAPQPGVVFEKYVEEGQLVTSGMPLFKVSSERYDVNSGPVQAGISQQLQHRLDLLRGELDKTRRLHVEERDTLNSKLINLERELSALKSQTDSQRRLVALANDAARRYQGLMDKGYISMDQLQQRQAEQLGQVRMLQGMERERASLEQQRIEHRNELSGLDSRQANLLAQMRRQLSALEQELTESEARRTLLITAPESGIATAVLAEVGHSVDNGFPLLSIVPADSPLQAELYAPSKAIGFIRPGDTVNIRYHAYPYQKFGLYRGSVLSISRTSLSPTELANRGNGMKSLAQNSEQLYRLRIHLNDQTVMAYGQARALQSGMLLEGDILQETRRIYEWVLDPLYSLTGKL
ncbi:HlyD family secretion protein [Achromobacter aegrifaciens]|uniref:HlyD family secretion protein n=1 Tax=Achromobacter aegrifaciens TaxID=1287736 RepID=UPI0028AB8C7F|nr:HlyD family efflux transporter periplasmic adaptor subunit [Achromobacter aegrifaciens]